MGSLGQAYQKLGKVLSSSANFFCLLALCAGIESGFTQEAHAQKEEGIVFTDISNVEYVNVTFEGDVFEYVSFTASKNGEEPETHEIHFTGPRMYRGMTEGQRRLLIGAASSHETDEGKKKRKPSWELERIDGRIIHDPYGDVRVIDDVVPKIPTPAPGVKSLVEELSNIL